MWAPPKGINIICGQTKRNAEEQDNGVSNNSQNVKSSRFLYEAFQLYLWIKHGRIFDTSLNHSYCYVPLENLLPIASFCEFPPFFFKKKTHRLLLDYSGGGCHERLIIIYDFFPFYFRSNAADFFLFLMYIGSALSIVVRCPWPRGDGMMRFIQNITRRRIDRLPVTMPVVRWPPAVPFVFLSSRRCWASKSGWIEPVEPNTAPHHADNERYRCFMLAITLHIIYELFVSECLCDVRIPCGGCGLRADEGVPVCTVDVVCTLCLCLQVIQCGRKGDDNVGGYISNSSGRTVEGRGWARGVHEIWWELTSVRLGPRTSWYFFFMSIV